MSEDKRPDFLLQVKDKMGGGMTRAGAAWKNSHGGITIKLNPCVVLSQGGLRDSYLTLWPNKAKHPEAPSDDQGDPADFGPPPQDDDIPF